MISVLSGIDFITTQNTAKLLEFNTDINLNDNDVSKFNFQLIVDYIIEKKLKKLHLIYKPYITSTLFVENIKKTIENNNFTFLETKVDNDSIVYPIPEEHSDTLILRFAYSARSIFDDLYCRDKSELIKLIFENNLTELFVKTYYTNYDNLDEFLCVVEKKILPTVNNSLFPKIHKLKNIDELNKLKNSIEHDSYLNSYDVETKNRCWFLISNQMNDLFFMGNTLDKKDMEFKYDMIFRKILEIIKIKHS